MPFASDPKMVGSGTLSSRSLDGLPLAWGAKARAKYMPPGPIICRRPLGVRGYLCAWTGTAAFFFRGK
jgi:hypothetical protein